MQLCLAEMIKTDEEGQKESSLTDATQVTNWALSGEHWASSLHELYRLQVKSVHVTLACRIFITRNVLLPSIDARQGTQWLGHMWWQKLLRCHSWHYTTLSNSVSKKLVRYRVLLHTVCIASWLCSSTDMLSAFVQGAWRSSGISVKAGVHVLNLVAMSDDCNKKQHIQ